MTPASHAQQTEMERTESEELGRLNTAYHAALSDSETTRNNLGRYLRHLLDEGVPRKVLADRLDCNVQTVSNIAYGRAPRNGTRHA
jgi:hypothetical protein